MTKSLKHQLSTLDLIDDSTLTSLPFPPPPPIKKRSSTLSNNSSSNKIRPVNSSSLSQFPIHKSKDTITSDEDNEEDEIFEYSYEEEDPIVLVEDYLTSNNPFYTTHNLSRQKSLADFKKRIMSNNSVNSSSSLNSSIDTIRESQETQTNTTMQTSLSSNHQQQVINDLQSIFGNLPSFELLKYCDLCNKPLYEISSIINSTTITNNSCTASFNLNEFICGDCVENYEIFLNVYNNNLEYVDKNNVNMTEENRVGERFTQKNNNKTKNSKLWNILHQISCKYNIKREVI
ncbi:uncharacterized protein KGF55_005628 [Candida pseudojiufengensis]|uniref:uncharacterized protein n=1 Tax=Candida pseudojiufengensis TaxID=497109 RepID=UPI0022256654|nr:uncharacterized protein KGF55_005628 [Candida pseudojiufengensis]KAI5958974.1 hypothetical protein KGF55_005628 [Candida pseudojiufengensis]